MPFISFFYWYMESFLILPPFVLVCCHRHQKLQELHIIAYKPASVIRSPKACLCWHIRQFQCRNSSPQCSNYDPSSIYEESNTLSPLCTLYRAHGNLPVKFCYVRSYTHARYIFRIELSIRLRSCSSNPVIVLCHSWFLEFLCPFNPLHFVSASVRLHHLFLWGELFWAINYWQGTNIYLTGQWL